MSNLTAAAPRLSKCPRTCNPARLAAAAAHGHLDLAEIRTTDTAVETGRTWREKK